jgi:hypothetical protein
MLAQWRDAPVALDSGSGALQPRYGAVRSVRFCLHFLSPLLARLSKRSRCTSEIATDCFKN